MQVPIWIVLAIGGAAAIASVGGGALALWHRPSSLVSSIALGTAGGALIGTVAFEMLPQALQLSDAPAPLGGLVVGFGVIYGVELYFERGQIAGSAADQRDRVAEFHEAAQPIGQPESVLGVGALLETAVEGLSIGIGTALNPTAGVIIALAVTIDNLSEGMSIGEVARRRGGSRVGPRVLLWAAGVGAVTLVASVVGWLAFRNLPDALMAGLFGAGAGILLYVSLAQLVPEGERQHYQRSSTLATGAAFSAIFLLSALGGTLR